ncbi:MAG: DUF4270 domain-containing protein [Bacteroidales bacterium]|nr:DUF4270 domain-containing protein [Bacteroidota bacterium]MBL6950465.1 DUF4270 domain-containing protein [Bacteroidales bacterium]
MRILPQLLFRAIWISLLVVFIVVSCKKDPYEIGLELLPPSDTLYVSKIDTVTVVAYSEIMDSIRTDELPSLVLGSIVDPVFGKTTASFYTQFLLSSEQIDFGVNPRLDSLVLILYYGTYYGDTNTLQQLRVFEVSEDIDYDSSYYSNQSLDTYGIELANMTYRPAPKDSIIIWGKPVAPHLRINLSNHSNYLGNKILFAPDHVLSSTTEFVNFMKGLYVEAIPVSSRGALINYVPSTGLSKMVIYFRNEDVGDSLHFNLPIDLVSARFNTYNHHGYEDASPDFKQQLVYKDTTLGKNQVYLQSLGGVKLKLQFPYFKSLLDSLGPIAINSAILTFKNSEMDSTWIPPPQLAMYKVDSAGRITQIIDELDGLSYFGGAYNKDERIYWFRLTRHFQRLLLSDSVEKYNTYVFPSNPLIRNTTANRVILNGTNPIFSSSPADRIKLSITYTRMQ